MNIEGWMSEVELAWLSEQASLFSSIVEVGCWKGRSTRVLAENCVGIVYAVDMWNPAPAPWMDQVTRAKAEFYPRERGYIYQQFYWNLKSQIDTGKVVPVRSASTSATKVPPVKFVFIDAGHDYESVRSDVAAWKPRCRKRLAGHDYSIHWPSVMQAIDEFLPQRNIVPNTSIWYVDI